jgi:hypothetical protein
MILFRAASDLEVWPGLHAAENGCDSSQIYFGVLLPWPLTLSELCTFWEIISSGLAALG